MTSDQAGSLRPDNIKVLRQQMFLMTYLELQHACVHTRNQDSRVLLFLSFLFLCVFFLMAALCVLHNALCLLCQPVVRVASGTRN